MDSNVSEMMADQCSMSLYDHIYRSLRIAIIEYYFLEVHSCIRESERIQQTIV